VAASTANKRLPIRVIAPASPSDGVCKNACHAYAIAAPPARLSRWIARQPVRFDQIKVGTIAKTYRERYATTAHQAHSRGITRKAEAIEKEIRPTILGSGTRPLLFAAGHLRREKADMIKTNMIRAEHAS
jgi:hypothetical protein